MHFFFTLWDIVLGGGGFPGKIPKHASSGAELRV